MSSELVLCQEKQEIHLKFMVKKIRKHDCPIKISIGVDLVQKQDDLPTEYCLLISSKLGFSIWKQELLMGLS